jgi:hypothetical protein
MTSLTLKSKRPSTIFLHAGQPVRATKQNPIPSDWVNARQYDREVRRRISVYISLNNRVAPLSNQVTLFAAVFEFRPAKANAWSLFAFDEAR